MQEAYFKDFMILNRFLLKEYEDVSEMIIKITVAKDIPIIEGVTTESLEAIVNDLVKDSKAYNGSLEVFTYDSITSYIKTCVDRIVYEILQIE